MTADAVGDGVEKHRTIALSQDPLLPPEGIDDGQRIVPIHALGVHLVQVDPGADPGNELNAHGFAQGLPPHAIEIIHAVKNNGQATAEGFVPERAVLVHRRKRNPFPHRPAPKRGVSDVGHHDSGLAVHALIQSGAGRNRS